MAQPCVVRAQNDHGHMHQDRRSFRRGTLGRRKPEVSKNGERRAVRLSVVRVAVRARIAAERGRAQTTGLSVARN